MGQRRFAAEGALVVAAFFFGVTFPLVHDALEDVTPFAYLVLRFSHRGAGARARSRCVVARRRGEDRRLLVRVGVIAGVLLFGGYATQTVGLQYTSPSTSAFITGLYVMLHAVRRRRWSSHACRRGAWWGRRARDGRPLPAHRRRPRARRRRAARRSLCALLFAIWIVYQGAYANAHPPDPVHDGADGHAGRRRHPGHGPPGDRRPHAARAWFAIVFTGIACSAVALSLQLWGQQRIAAEPGGAHPAARSPCSPV